MIYVLNMSDTILQQNNICTKCHVQLSADHVCVDDDIICPRFYTHEELIEKAKHQRVEFVYVRRERPKTR